MAHSFTQSEDAEHVFFSINYTEGDLKKIGCTLYDVIDAFGGIEQAFYNAFIDRLKLDSELLRIRAQIDRLKNKVAKRLIKDFDIKAPSIIIPRVP
jgi:hypothetical protein